MEHRNGERTPIEWSGLQRLYSRDERAEMEANRRAVEAGVDFETWESMQRQNELAHGELTQRFLASKGAMSDDET